VRVHGATTVTFGLIKPHKEGIEKKAGTSVILQPSSTSRGLTDLAQGKADIAMLAEPLNTAAASLNQKQPGAVNESDFVGKHVGDAYVEFIINPVNPVQRLSKDQLAGIFSGKIKNWSEVGGAAQPIMVVGEPSSSPHKIIGNALAIAFAPELRVVGNVRGKPAWAVGRGFVMFPTCPLTRSAISKPRPRLSVLR
jgi:ABC-type phosphate transport system substrate-binding protein